MAILKKDNKKEKKAKLTTSNDKKTKVVGLTKTTSSPILTKVKKPNNKQTNPETTNKKPKKLSSNILNAILSLVMFIGIVGMLGIILFSAYIVVTAPAFDTDRLYNKEATVFYDKFGNEFASVGAEQRELKTYDDLPETFIDAIVATEDSRFFQHNGFDVVRFIKASLGQFTGQAGAGGASTITMQVAKNAFSRSDNGEIASGLNSEGIIRKFHDIYISIFRLEKNYTKEEILEYYVNYQWFGSNAWGVEKGAQYYYGKSISDLTLAEASLLAGVFNSPSSYNPYNNLELATQRRSTVLSLMQRHGYITEEQADDAEAIPVASLLVDQKTNTGETINKYQQFIDIVCKEISEKYKVDPYSVPMEIYTTMDPTIQDVMISLNDGSLGYQWVNDYIQVGIAITDVNDGSIAAVDGGRGQTTARIESRATRKDKEPGSTAKPIFAYGPYIEYNNGFPGTIFYDEKYTYSNGQPVTNHDGKYQGAMTMRTALVRSRNIPALQAFQAVDKQKISEFVNACGIDYFQYDTAGNLVDDNLYESYALGGGLNISPLDMAAAYATFARGGYYIEPYSFTKIIFKETGEEKEWKYVKTQAMSAETAYLITDMLITATKQGVGGNIKVSGTEVASKTGTSTYPESVLKAKKIPLNNVSNDNWVITYSPDYTISIWYGVDNGEESSSKFTYSGPATTQKTRIMAAIANKIYKKNSKFIKPTSIISSNYELESFPVQLPSAFTPSNLISTEVFKKGTEPSEISDRFDTLSNPSNGRVEVTNSQIKLSWNPINTPNAINPTYLASIFTEKNYNKFAEAYYNNRLSYNNDNIGNIGYQVYLNTTNGLQLLGFTTSPSYVYNAPYNGTYTFVIKSAYSIFKDNMSSGINLTATVTSGIGLPVEPEDPNDPTDPDDPDEPEDPQDPENSTTN